MSSPSSGDSSSALCFVGNYKFNSERDFLGKGMYGEVYRAVRAHSKCDDSDILSDSEDRNDSFKDGNEREYFAMKRTRYTSKKEGMPASTIRELMVLKKVSEALEKPSDHMLGAENVVRLRDFIVEKEAVYIVSEFCEGGDLSHFLSKQPKSRLNDRQWYRSWMRDLLRGLCFLHRKGISHRDLKPQNILLKASKKWNIDPADGADTIPEKAQHIIKIADFGLSRIEGIPVKKYQHETITLWYRSPDVLLGNTNYSFTADIWSAGCILAETASGNALFRGKDNADHLKFIFGRLGPPTQRNFPSMKQYANYEKYVHNNNCFNEVMHLDYDPVKYSNNEFAFAIKRLTHYFQRYGALGVVGKDGIDLLAHMLAYEPGHRLTAEEALQHPFFTTILPPISCCPSPKRNTEGLCVSGSCNSKPRNSNAGEDALNDMGTEDP
ncbi:Protein tyrosine kinase Protein kinase domain [Trypanosoma vivax]|uniref:Protein kinase domain-containing protein n=1 Tax=Trypanosoma vivax (strain Y486) TaxID=1055687 RepID=G0TTE8_TRYVY|nr:putative protein kinase [Trypanosoma vivax]KAH8605794.1 Protein tyrosine kinase Protein kinase domain [Trypanosoma vivax]CCC47229.1 putative protein kinase [Trypanosoma vivax Y486]